MRASLCGGRPVALAEATRLPGMVMPHAHQGIQRGVSAMLAQHRLGLARGSVM